MEKEREFAYASVFHYISSLGGECAKVFVFKEELFFDANSTIFGMSEIIFNYPDKCEIIFGKDEIEEVFSELEVDVELLIEERENYFEYEKIVDAIVNKIKNKGEFLYVN